MVGYWRGSWKDELRSHRSSRAGDDSSFARSQNGKRNQNVNVQQFNPAPGNKEVFRPDRRKFVATGSGCYVLATFEGRVLYIGRTKNLRRRFTEHLESDRMTAVTSDGRAFFFHWLERNDIERGERTWLNACKVADARLPVLNLIDASISI